MNIRTEGKTQKEIETMGLGESSKADHFEVNRRK